MPCICGSNILYSLLSCNNNVNIDISESDIQRNEMKISVTL